MGFWVEAATTVGLLLKELVVVVVVLLVLPAIGAEPDRSWWWDRNSL